MEGCIKSFKEVSVFCNNFVFNSTVYPAFVINYYIAAVVLQCRGAISRWYRYSIHHKLTA
jgi:hypothetical protein